MKNSDIGITKEMKTYLEELGLNDMSLARVIREYKERYSISDGNKEYDAEILGNLRYAAEDRSDFPAVGDYVAFSPFDDSNAIIHKVLPRRTIIERQAVGKYGERQIIATNIDFTFIVQSVGYDFNINRLERYLIIANTAKVLPIFIINKVDLAAEGEVESIFNQLKERNIQLPVYFVSAVENTGFDELKDLFERGKTYCFMGSSGVGKSTLINKLLEDELMETQDISQSTSKGKHTTSHRELIMLSSGGMVIDTPGMRELGMTDSAAGLEETFQEIVELADECKYSDCTHTNEAGCAVTEAVENGEIHEKTYQNFLKLEREKQHFQSTIAERRSKDKEFGKMVKHVKKHDKRYLDESS